jgi:hypothetical protein
MYDKSVPVFSKVGVRQSFPDAAENKNGGLILILSKQ